MFDHWSKRQKTVTALTVVAVFIMVGLISWGISADKFSSSASGTYGGSQPRPVQTNDVGPGSLAVSVTCDSPCDQFGALQISYSLNYAPKGFLGYQDPTHYNKSVVLDSLSYAFNNLPLGNYVLTVSRKCPPNSAQPDGSCGYRQSIMITGGNTADVHLGPSTGSMAISLWRQVSNPGPQSNCTDEDKDGLWDCPITAELTCWSSDNEMGPIIYKLSTDHKIIQGRRAGETITCSATAGTLRADEQSKDITGCIRDIFKLYLY